MPEEPFLLVSLKEKEAKELAQVISSKTCRKILDALSKGSATESDLSKKLNLPMSTIHYNLQLLIKSKLIKADEFHYSQKGKEVLHYSLSNKYVIIAPKQAPETFKDKLKKILPFAAIILAAGALIQFFNKSLVTTKTFGTRTMSQVFSAMPSPGTFAAESAENAVEEAARGEIAKTAALPQADMVASNLINTTQNTSHNITTTMLTNSTELINTSKQIVREPLMSSTNIAMWFVLGAIFAGIVVWIILWLTRKK